MKLLSPRTIFGITLQTILTAATYILAQIAVSMIIPLNFAQGARPIGILPAGSALMLNAIGNALILIWAAHRSSLSGWKRFGQILVVSFGAQTFQTQIESAYFLEAFPALQNNFAIYALMARGLILSAIISLIAVLITGGFRKGVEEVASTTKVETPKLLRAGAALGGVYFVLYVLAGYYIAWQSDAVRHFYGGPAILNSFGNQIANMLMGNPEMPVFQYFRGILWILCLLPILKSFKGSKAEVTAFSGAALAFLPTMQLLFPNALMPAGVEAAHLMEVAISTGLFGILTAVFIVDAKRKA